MKCALSVLFALVLSISLSAQGEHQVLVFKSFKDFESGIGTTHAGYAGMGHSAGKPYIRVSDVGREFTKYKFTEMWGFRYKEKLIRVDGEEGWAACLIEEGGICYWENGYAHVTMANTSSTAAGIDYGYVCYLSKGVKGNLVPLPHLDMANAGGGIPIRPGKYKDFRKSQTALKDLFDCLDAEKDRSHARQCILDFNDRNP